MAFKKIAFNLTEHMKISEAILGNSFKEVHRYMDGSGGFHHRENHGHNKIAEQEIRQKYGEEGVNVFIIHLICDELHKTYLQDKVIPEVKKRYEEIKNGKRRIPYFEKREGLYCQEILNQESRGADPQAKITKILNKCEICNGEENLYLVNMHAICNECFEERGLIICINRVRPSLKSVKGWG